MTLLIILSAVIISMMAVIVAQSQLAPFVSVSVSVYALRGENHTTTYPPVPTCTYNPVIECTTPPSTVPSIPTCSIPPLNGTLPCNNENKSISWLDNFTGPHYVMPCKDSPSTVCYYPAPSTHQTQTQSQQNGTTTLFGGLPKFAKTHNNITMIEPTRPTIPGGCLWAAVACGP